MQFSIHTNRTCRNFIRNLAHMRLSMIIHEGFLQKSNLGQAPSTPNSSQINILLSEYNIIQRYQTQFLYLPKISYKCYNETVTIIRRRTYTFTAYVCV